MVRKSRLLVKLVRQDKTIQDKNELFTFTINHARVFRSIHEPQHTTSRHKKFDENKHDTDRWFFKHFVFFLLLKIYKNNTHIKYYHYIFLKYAKSLRCIIIIKMPHLTWWDESLSKREVASKVNECFSLFMHFAQSNRWFHARFWLVKILEWLRFDLQMAL